MYAGAVGPNAYACVLVLRTYGYTTLGASAVDRKFLVSVSHKESKRGTGRAGPNPEIPVARCLPWLVVGVAGGVSRIRGVRCLFGPYSN